MFANIAFTCLSLLAMPGFTQGASPTTGSAELSATQRKALDTTLERIRTRAGVPGLAIGIVDRGKPLYTGVFGVRDLATGTPVKPETLFHIASISKTFTATAIMQLVEQRKLALDDPLEHYLPAFASSGITIEQLLTHSAGLKDWVHPSGGGVDADVEKYIQRVAKHRRAYPPGKGWEYSDADFNILGAVIEKVSGETYPDYLAAHVFAVSGLGQTTAYLPPPTADFAWPHRGEQSARRAKQHPWDRVFIPSSGIESNITDLMRWAVVNLERDPALLSSASYVQLFQRSIDTEWHDVAMGLGWQLELRDEHWLPFHPGGDPGFRTLLMLYPAQQRAIVILSNGEATPRFEIRDAIEALLEH